jgi:hypothetical protein
LRVLPLFLLRVAPGGRMARFFAATGVAAIAALFAAGVLGQGGAPLATLLGSAAVVGVFYATRSVVAATLAGSLIYGIAFSVF